VDVEHELQRLRDWRHAADGTLVAFKLRIEQLEKVVASLTPKIDRLARADEIAEAVRLKLDGAQRVKFTRWQVLGGLIVAAAAVADTIARFTQHG
jgi:hypothetical protein